MSHIDSFKQQAKLIREFGEGNAYLVWALSLYLDLANSYELGSESLTDGFNDKKIDFIRYEPDTRRVICAQGYYSAKKVDSAPANKASDLNTAAAWLLNGDLTKVPEVLRSKIVEIREAIAANEVDQFDFLYVHNLPESVGVAQELNTLRSHFESVLPADCAASVVAKELGYEEVERIFNAKETHIRVNDDVECPAVVRFSEKGPHWDASVLSVPGAWLRELYLKHGDDLYSANYRGFLGTNKRKKINTGIRQTAESDPKNFWVYNNGITILTRKITPTKGGVRLSGLSIINGAQTSGSLGSVESSKFDLSSVQVLCRIIECSEQETISSIVRYNNTQNEITTWDQYSNNPEQHRIKREFENIGYTYSLKRGFEAANADISIESVAAPLLAFDGNYRDANIGKNYIFDTKSLYKATFDAKKARHVLLVATCASAIDELRSELRRKMSDGSIIEIEARQIELFQSLRFKNFLIAVLARSLSVVVAKAISVQEVAFSPDASNRGNNNFNGLVAHWMPLVKTVLTYVAASINISFADYLKLEKPLDDAVKNVTSLLYVAKIQNPNAFSDFAALISES
jgi:hypothetical protein